MNESTFQDSPDSPDSPITQTYYVSFDVGIKNLAYCVFSVSDCAPKPYIPRDFTILEWDTLDLSQNDTVDTRDVQSLSCSIIRHIDTIHSKYSIKFVIIENQPCLKNPTMKTVQICIYSYFATKKALPPHTVQQLYLYSATNKLKVLKLLSKTDQQAIEASLKQYESKNAYTQRKKQAITITQHLLRQVTIHTPSLSQHFIKSKKQDDLADAFLQGYHFVMS